MRLRAGTCHHWHALPIWKGEACLGLVTAAMWVDTVASELVRPAFEVATYTA